MPPQTPAPLEVFYSYSHKDEELRDELQTHLTMLQRKGVISGWHDRGILAGQEWGNAIDEHLDSADIVLLLVSPDFLASSYCYDIEMSRAMDRHSAGEALVIPIILRPSDWTLAPFAALQGLPKGAEPITLWPNRDQAFLSVVDGLRQAASQLNARRASTTDGPATTPRLATPYSIPRPPVLGFVRRRDAHGRDIVDRLKEELAPERNQRVTLSGPGGIGKSTLAAQAARALLGEYRGRVVWSSALARADFTVSTLHDDIATQLGREDIRRLASAEKADEVRALVAEPPALVVIDNFETIDEGAQRDIEEWFTGAQCSFLFTSRADVAETKPVAVSAMSREEAEEFLETVVATTRDPQIFSAGVRKQIYETSEANPFVMKWVVAQIGQAQEPATVFKELLEGDGDAAQRVFDRSFNLPQLGDDGRAALLALSLFVPSATREALAVVAGFGQDQKRLNEAVKNLHALWLIKGIDQNRRLTVEGLTRSLAEARLSRDNRASEFRQRFVAYFLKYAEDHKGATSDDYDVLELQKDNLFSAANAAFALEQWESVIRLAYLLASPGMLVVRGYWDDALRIGSLALEAARLSGDDAMFARLAHIVAVVHQDRGELDEARRLYGESLEIKKRLDDQSGIASTLHELGRLAQAQGELDEARRLYDESLEIAKRLGNQRVIAGTLHQLGWLAQAQGELDEARRLYGESLEIQKRLGNQSGIADTLHNLATIAQAQGELDEARRLCGESLEIKKRLGNQSGTAFSLWQLGRLAESDGDVLEAGRLFREALEIFERLKSPKAKGVRKDLSRVEGMPS